MILFICIIMPLLFFVPILRLRSRVLLTTHGIHTENKFWYLSSLYILINRIFFPFFNAITTVSKDDYSIALKIKKENVYYIPNGVNESLLTNTLSTNQEDYLLFAAGRIYEGKGCHIFLESLIRINYKGSVMIIGELEHASIGYKNRIENLAKYLPDVRFVGFVNSKNKLNEYILNSKLFIYPSEKEAMSMMLLEVAILKVPIICSDEKFNRDLFLDGEVLFAKTNDINDWATKIEWALKNIIVMKENALGTYQRIKK